MMNILYKVNQFRRDLMSSLTKNIGKQKTENNIILADKSEIKHILICRPNGRLGNLLLITPLIQEVTDTFPACKIDLFVKGKLASIVFENYKTINKIIYLPKKPFKSLLEYAKAWILIRNKAYDMVINVDQNSSSGRLAVRFSKAKHKFYGDLNGELAVQKNDYDHIAKYPVYNFQCYLTKLGLPAKNKTVAPLDLKLTSQELHNGKKILELLANPLKRTICIFTYATGIKCFSKEWWEDFYYKLKAEYQNYNIIEILPIENVSQIGFKAPTYYSKDIREMGSVLANVDLFIGADSGIMHLASSVQTTTIGLFSVSNLKKYQPYHNGSVGIDIKKCTQIQYFKIINSILENRRLKLYS